MIGKSAYEIAVDEGYEGTKEQWLASLVGEAGAKGNDGKDGVDGKSAYELAVLAGYEGDIHGVSREQRGDRTVFRTLCIKK